MIIGLSNSEMLEILLFFAASFLVVKILEGRRFYSVFLMLINISLLLFFSLIFLLFYIDSYFGYINHTVSLISGLRYYIELIYFFLLACHVISNRHYFSTKLKSFVGLGQNQSLPKLILDKGKGFAKLLVGSVRAE